MSRQQYLTIHALTKYIKRKFDADPHMQNMYVKGEISNFKEHTSGHMYFTLKDETARVSAVMFSRANRNLKFAPENGMKVLIRGDITVYEQSGQYQIYVNEMQPDGVGDLFLAYEQLKEKLEKEGLFLAEHKKTLPKYPNKIGVITSPTGAAIRDIISTIQRRYPLGDIIIFPALVQGEPAASSIVRAIEAAHTNKSKVDVLIVGRGGGSIEELWAFNEEIVARAIYAAKIPIISAVGHETDFTIADFVADLRAPTPTAAAELAVPHIEELLEKVHTNKGRLIRAMNEKLTAQRERLTRIEKSYAFRYPQKRYEQKLEQLDKLTEQLFRSTRRIYGDRQEKLRQMNRRLKRNHLDQLINTSNEELERASLALNKAMNDIFIHKQKDFNLLVSTLEALNPLKIMDRGYSVVYSDQGKIVKSVKEIEQTEQVDIHLTDGRLHCEVLQVEEGE